MPTGQTIINNALTALNILDAGGTPSASESTDLLGELNVQVDAWATDETLIPSILTSQYALTAAYNPYAMGAAAAGYTGAVLLGSSIAITAATNANPAVLTSNTPHGLTTGQIAYLSGFSGAWASVFGTFAVIVVSPTTFSIPVNSTSFGALTGTSVFALLAARPVRIDQAALVSTVGAGTTRKPLKIVGSKTYFGHGDLAAAATTADEIYPDWAEGLMQVYLFPVPSCPTATKLELETWNAIAAFALGTNQALPPGYQDAIQQALAYRCLTRYGAAVNPETAQIVTDLGKQAKQRVQELNVKNRLLDPALLEQSQPPQQAQQGQR
jgi:hypothetical protein